MLVRRSYYFLWCKVHDGAVALASIMHVHVYKGGNARPGCTSKTKFYFFWLYKNRGILLDASVEDREPSTIALYCIDVNEGK